MEVKEEDGNLVRAFFENMPHGLHLAEMVESPLFETLEEIHTQANELLGMWETGTKLHGARGLQIKWGKEFEKWRKGVQNFHDLIRTLWGDFMKFPDVVSVIGPQYKRSTRTFVVRGVEEQNEDWIYDWVGRDQL